MKLPIHHQNAFAVLLQLILEGITQVLAQRRNLSKAMRKRTL
jgi:hypothetical protein